MIRCTYLAGIDVLSSLCYISHATVTAKNPPKASRSYGPPTKTFFHAQNSSRNPVCGYRWCVFACIGSNIHRYAHFAGMPVSERSGRNNVCAL
jgi:hypothetical protein